ncbi:MAG: PQQ-binding-like beta-propeller repeat protein, partial [Pseudomonadota bacterium]
MKNFLLFIPLVVLISACSLFSGEEEAPPLPGERISILDLEEELTPVAAELAVPIEITLADPNQNWPQSGRIPQNLMGNLEMADIKNLDMIWKADIGKGSATRLPLTAQPVALDGRIFAIDTKSTVSAFDTQTGRLIWERNVRPESEDESVIAGGLGVDGNQLIVSAGYNEILSLDVTNGKINWRTAMSAGSRAAPTIDGNRVFIKTL